MFPIVWRKYMWERSWDEKMKIGKTKFLFLLFSVISLLIIVVYSGKNSELLDAKEEKLSNYSFEILRFIKIPRDETSYDRETFDFFLSEHVSNNLATNGL